MANKRYSAYSSFLLAFADFIFLIGLFFLFLFIHDPTWERSIHGLLVFMKVHYKSLILVVLFWFLVAGQVKLYKRFRFSRFLDVARRILFQVILFAFVLLAISGGKKEALYTSKESVVFVSVLFCYLLLTRAVIYLGLKIYREKGYNLRNVLIIGYNDNASNLINLINQKKEIGLRLADVMVSKNPLSGQKTLDLLAFDAYLIEHEIDFAYICLGNGIDEDHVNSITETLEKNFISTGFIPNTNLEMKQSLEINYLDSFPILTYKKYPLDLTFNQITKRIFDLIFTGIIFVLLLSWLLPVLALMVYFTQGKPILFKQKRNGLNGREFDCLKFRTMRDDVDNNKKPTERDDPRVTKLGRILRKTSLDELPQFINVLKGEMSIVGPRPHMVSENESYGEIIKRYSLRHYVKPGITGLAQVKGYRGAVDSEKDMEMRIKTDIYYVRNWSFLLDLFIIYKTAKLMIAGDENAI